MQKLRFSKVRDVKSPERGTPESAGIDFFVPNDYTGPRVNDFATTTLRPGQDVNIPSGIHVDVPKGYALIAFNKSGVATGKQLQVGACVVDEDYQGEVHIHVRNIGTGTTTIARGEKLVQFILIPVLYLEPVETKIENLYTEKTIRGTGAFGHTGRS